MYFTEAAMDTTSLHDNRYADGSHFVVSTDLTIYS